MTEPNYAAFACIASIVAVLCSVGAVILTLIVYSQERSKSESSIHHVDSFVRQVRDEASARDKNTRKEIAELRALITSTNAKVAILTSDQRQPWHDQLDDLHTRLNTTNTELTALRNMYNRVDEKIADMCVYRDATNEKFTRLTMRLDNYRERTERIINAIKEADGT